MIRSHPARWRYGGILERVRWTSKPRELELWGETRARIETGDVLDRLRAEQGEAPDDTTRTTCHWCGRKWETPLGRGIHEARCRQTAARDQRILAAYREGQSGTAIAEAEGMGWSAVYRVLRSHGIRGGDREGAA